MEEPPAAGSSTAVTIAVDSGALAEQHRRRHRAPAPSRAPARTRRRVSACAIAGLRRRRATAAAPIARAVPRHPPAPRDGDRRRTDGVRHQLATEVDGDLLRRHRTPSAEPGDRDEEVEARRGRPVARVVVRGEATAAEPREHRLGDARRQHHRGGGVGRRRRRGAGSSAPTCGRDGVAGGHRHRQAWTSSVRACLVSAGRCRCRRPAVPWPSTVMPSSVTAKPAASVGLVVDADLDAVRDHDVLVDDRVDEHGRPGRS